MVCNSFRTVTRQSHKGSQNPHAPLGFSPDRGAGVGFPESSEFQTPVTQEAHAPLGFSLDHGEGVDFAQSHASHTGVTGSSHAAGVFS